MSDDSTRADKVAIPLVVKETTVQPAKRRWHSVDALRGFDMFWIIGAGSVAHALNKISTAEPIARVEEQLHHVPWEGLRAYDVIFPLFVFLAGCSIVFSLESYDGKRGAALWRIGRRTAVLFFLGVIYNGGFRTEWPDMRIMGVLQRIALCYGATALLFLFVRRGWILVLVTTALLAGYWAAMTYIDVPGVGVGSTDEGKNLADWFDSKYLPGRAHRGLDWDPEGLLSTLPAIGTCLLGVLAGLMIQKSRFGPGLTGICLIVAGAGLAASGWYWGESFPIIKKIWTSSYVLLCGGISFALLGLFHLVVEGMGLRAWARPLLWIGANPLSLYFSWVVINYGDLTERLVGGSIQNQLGERWGPFVLALLPLAMVLFLAWFLSRKKIFLRI